LALQPKEETRPWSWVRRSLVVRGIPSVVRTCEAAKRISCAALGGGS
jgi:hypothetical protein